MQPPGSAAPRPQGSTASGFRLPASPAPRPGHPDSPTPGFSVTWLPGPWFHGFRLRGPATLIPRLRLLGYLVPRFSRPLATRLLVPRPQTFLPPPAMQDVSAPGSRATPRCESPGEESRTPAAYGPAVRRRSPPRPRATTRSGSGCPVPEGCGGCGRCRR